MKRDWFLLLGSIMQFALLVPLSRWAHKHQQPPSELAVTHLLQHRQTSLFRAGIGVLNTLTGSAVFLNVLVVPIAAVLWKIHLRFQACALLASCWTGITANTVLKKVVARSRPPLLLVRNNKQSPGNSFPSGHVVSSVCVWGWIVTLGWLSRQKIPRKKRVLLPIPAVFVIFTGPARVYLGDHWSTDVLGGYLFGGGWLSLSLYFYQRWEKGKL
jgi:membrane-associated phospholipid phosphatase